jgi:hypothetical protein
MQDILRDALKQIVAAAERCFERDLPGTELQGLRDIESGRRLVYSKVAGIARTALEQSSPAAPARGDFEKPGVKVQPLTRMR